MYVCYECPENLERMSVVSFLCIYKHNAFCASVFRTGFGSWLIANSRTVVSYAIGIDCVFCVVWLLLSFFFLMGEKGGGVISACNHLTV